MPKLKTGNEDERLLSSSREELESSFIARMEICAEMVGSVSALAKKAGISQGGVRRYFAGSEPSRPHLIAIATAAGVRASWLVTGELPMRAGEAVPEASQSLGKPDISLDALEDVIVKVRAMLRKKRPDLSLKAEARIIRLVYEFYMKQGESMDDAILDNVIELAAFR